MRPVLSVPTSPFCPWPLREEMCALLFRVGTVAGVHIARIIMPQLPSKYLIDQNKTRSKMLQRSGFLIQKEA